MKKNMLLLLISLFSCLFIHAQKNRNEKKELIPFIGFNAGGCVKNPFQLTAGFQQPVKKHISLAYDFNLWRTNYTNSFEGVYSEGKYLSFTPSIKIFYNTGQETGRGIFAGLGLGYMVARDRGFERSYSENPQTGIKQFSEISTHGKWDFHSIAPSVTLGIGFRIHRLPASVTTVYYFAKTSNGWEAAEGGIGMRIGLKKIAK